MAFKQRAIAVEDKEVRRHALLDAAEALFLEHPDRMASVAEVAQAAGVAKGTVYLYFPSKEEMLLALHERHMAHYFAALMKLLDGRARGGLRRGLGDDARTTSCALPGYLAAHQPLPRPHGPRHADRGGRRVQDARRRRRSPPPAPASSATFPALGKGDGVTPPAAQLRAHRGAVAAPAPDRALRHRHGARRARDVQARLRARARAGACARCGRERWAASPCAPPRGEPR